MSGLMVNRTPEIIAAEINGIKEQTRKMVLYNSIEIGRKLTEAKLLVEHGEWGHWLETAVDYSKSTANNLMKIFQEYGSDQMSLLDNNLKSQAFGNLSYSQAVLLLGVPSEDREKFVKEHDVEDMSTRELEKVIKELKKAEKEKEEAIKAKDKAEEKLNNIEDANRAWEEAFNTEAQERNKLEAEIKRLNKELVNAEETREAIEVDVDKVEVNEELEAKIEELTREKEEAERKIKDLEAKQNDSSVKFRIYFKEEAELFQKLFEELAYVKSIDEIEHIKLKGALEKFLNSMLQRVMS